MDLTHYELLAQLFEYPDTSSSGNDPEILLFVRKHYPDAGDQLDLFYSYLPVDSLNEKQELFTRTFDIQAITTLGVGYVLFGDDYKRGELLANLNREHKQANNNCGCELSDHLPNVLRLLPKCKDAELIEELVSQIIAPALSKMISEFCSPRREKKNALYKKHYKTLIEFRQGEKAAAYCYALKALELVLHKDFVIKSVETPDQSLDFLQSLETEMAVEKIESE
ncbi:MAG: hypothetical protein K8I00_10110 [Candidatus Omnitrophica bacterium]|nr:hypothetical protein [Candidatus Omnitrophota bacterium]